MGNYRLPTRPPVAIAIAIGIGIEKIGAAFIDSDSDPDSDSDQRSASMFDCPGIELQRDDGMRIK